MTASAAPPSTPGAAPRSALLGVLVLLWGAATAVALTLEVGRLADPNRRALALRTWFADETADWTPFVPVLLSAPLFWRLSIRRRPVPGTSTRPPGDSSPSGPPDSEGVRASFGGGLLAAASCGVLAMVMAWRHGAPFDGLPPNFHDEFSYVFQARTFLAGRLWFPSFSPAPELFDQIHVLNEGRFASRYFPGCGAWIAPWLALERPWWGHWLANGLAAAMVSWIAGRLSGVWAGWWSGGLMALSPGLIVFANHLLAHHPTLVGLLVFLIAILRCRRSPSAGAALAAGIGLSFAMLCRPMTAAGFALPFGVDWLLRWAPWSRRDERAAPFPLRPGERASSSPGEDAPPAPRAATTNGARPTWRHTVCLCVPLVAGVVLQMTCNLAITGSVWLSPYQQYTNIYTPRHRYGFNNVLIGEQHLGPKVIDNYDRWALNLTPQLAAQNVAVRTITSFRWTLGLIPLALSLGVLLVSWPRLSAEMRLLLAAIASLHAAHVPYWYDGIMGWHYVFETAPLLLLAYAEASRRLFAAFCEAGATGLRWWWGLLTATALLVGHVSVPGVWQSRLEFAHHEAMFARARYGDFRVRTEAIAAREGPVIVFVEHDPDDRHIDYVSNPPSLEGPVLAARVRPGATDLARAAALIPDRRPYLFLAKSRELRPLNNDVLPSPAAVPTGKPAADVSPP